MTDLMEKSSDSKES